MADTRRPYFILIGADCVVAIPKNGSNSNNLNQENDDGDKSNNECSRLSDESALNNNCYDFTHVINKVGTMKLCQLAKQRKIPVYCFADHWKIWNDIYPPPIETKLFEIIPIQNMIDHVIVPN